MTETIESIEAREQAVTEREAANERRTAELTEMALTLTKSERHLSDVEAALDKREQASCEAEDRQTEAAKELKEFRTELEAQASEQGSAARASAMAVERAKSPLLPGTNVAGLRRNFDQDVVMRRRAEQIKEHTEKVNDDRKRGLEAQKAAADPKRTGRHLPNTSPYA